MSQHDISYLVDLRGSGVFGESADFDVSAGQFLTTQGELAQWVVAVTSGSMKFVKTEGPYPELVVDIRSADECLGAFEVLENVEYFTSAISLTPCSGFRIPKRSFLSAVQQDQTIQDDVRRHYHMSQRRINVRLSEMAILPAKDRLCRLLSYLTKQRDLCLTTGDGAYKLAVKKADLASAIGVTQSYFSRMLATLEYEGEVTRNNGWLVFRHPD